MGFNRVVRTFEEELVRPEYADTLRELEAVSEQFRRSEWALRADLARAWEHVHVASAVVEQSSRARTPLRLVDVGGGNAALAYLLARRGMDVTVVDVDPAVVEITNHQAHGMGLDASLRAVVGDTTRWPLPDETFDVGISVSVIEGVLRSRRPAFFAEARRVLVPGASLFLTFDYGPGARLVSDPPTSPEEVDRLLVRPSGFELVGDPIHVPEWDPERGPPVKNVVPAVEGGGTRVAEYSFGALHLRKPAT